MRHKFSVLNTARWEAGTIVEWLLYYRSIGFDHIYIYCNDDTPDEMHDVLMPFLLGPNPYVTFHHLPFQGQQDYCWLHFLEHHKDETEWFFFVDADEFLAIKETNSIEKFMEYRQKALDCINFNWIWFGPQDFEERPDGSTLLQFTRREDHRAQMNYFTKALTRSSAVDARYISRPPQPMLNHFWPVSVANNQRSANVLGYNFKDYTSNWPTGANEYLDKPGVREEILCTACTYHYLFRSRQDFVRRINRGLTGAYKNQTMWRDLHSNKEHFDGFLQRMHAYEDFYLRDYWAAYTKLGRDCPLVPTPMYRNFAPDSTPNQSSTCVWSNNRDPLIDAKGATNGRHTGEDGFHTDCEEFPWWSTDLGRIIKLKEIRIFNSIKHRDTALRANALVISLSDDGRQWHEIYKHAGRNYIGGVDGYPLIVPLERSARHVRVHLASRDYLHLDEIEIYGM